MVKRLITRLPDSPEIEAPAIIEQAGPVEVFRALLNRVRKTKGVIIDITGAKKNMVAGAFLFAAFADVPVSYVDFDEDAYDPDRRRPYGYGCQIGRLPNPYETFALRDWERVRELYQRYKFRDARLLVIGGEGNGSPGAILGAIKEYLPDAESAVQKMMQILHCYELWDTGDYNQAAQIANRLTSFQPPTAVSVLGGRWLTIEGTQFNMPESLYGDEQALWVYTFDELARIKRLIKYNRDYRSAFLRAGGLNEIVMAARMVEITQPRWQDEVLEKIRAEGIPWAQWLFEQLLLGESFKWHGIEFFPTDSMAKWWMHIAGNLFSAEDGWRVFLHRRNDLAHTFASVPERWGRDALRFVEANITDFWGSDPKTVDTNTIEWSKLCKLTGLDQYLSPNLCIDGKE
jgi:hypothetical protein